MAKTVQKKIFWLNFFIVVIVAFNLRAPITAIGPMIDVIKDAYGLNSTFAGVLTSLPLIAFGSISFIVGYFSPIRAIIVGIFLIFIGEILRSYTGIYGLFLGMLGIGCGIAIANVLLPSFIKEKFPKKIASMMGVYSLILSISSIVGVALTIPLLSVFDLAGAMVFWVIFSFVALVVYYPQAKNGRFFRAKKKSSKKINLFTNATTWKITLFMGFQSFLAYSLFFWYVQIVVEKGFDKEFATNMVLFAQLVAAPVSLFGPLLLGKLRQKLHTPYIASLCSMYVIAFAMLFVFDSKTSIIISAFIMGFPWGGVFGIALLFIAQKSSNTQVAAKLSALAQGFGYLIAAQGQWIIGFLHDKFENFSLAILMLIFVGVLVNIFGYLSYKSQVIR
ncbi:CynX/NimT family MFS transporter [Campylobacter jejuni]|nr:CynX/NimT family MFS transporter [Campylobacter jejuni]ECR1616313.1 CynX/NimT family MFS transporter [Campylobacter jejuni]